MDCDNISIVFAVRKHFYSFHVCGWFGCLGLVNAGGLNPGEWWLDSYTALVINIASCVDCCVSCTGVTLKDREAVSYCAGSVTLDVHDVCLNAGVDSVFFDGEFGCCFHVFSWLVG